jgi:hypothetical protein
VTIIFSPLKGEWLNDKIQGEGILYLSSGGYLQGNFLGGKVNGFAVLETPVGDVFRGHWKNGKLNGKCYKYLQASKLWFSCDYKDGVARYIDSNGFSILPKGKEEPRLILANTR